MPLVNDLNVDQLKLPLGFIKIPQLIFAVIAFTARSGWNWAVTYTCANGTPISSTVEGFDLKQIFQKCNNQGSDAGLPYDHTTFVWAARFFGFIAVISIIYCLIALYVYLFKWGVYAGDDRVPKMDLVITCGIAIWWFIATFVWWRATNALEVETDSKTVANRFKGGNFCDQKSFDDCHFESYAAYATLTVSVLAGVASLLLWASGIYFSYKETTWFRDRTKPTPSAMNSGGIA